MRDPDRTSSGPQYRQLARRIQKRIEEGVYAPGEPIPLAEDLSLEVPKSLSVVQRALRLLLEEGWLKEESRGVWLASRPRQVQGILLGWDPAETEVYGSNRLEIRVLSKVTATLPDEFLDHFEIHGVEGRRASRIVKVFLETDCPVMVETIIAPTSRLPGLVMKDHRHENIYKIIQTGYQTPISRVSQRGRLRSAVEEEAMALQIERKSMVLGIDRVLFSGGTGVAVERLAYSDLQRGFSDQAIGEFERADISR